MKRMDVLFTRLKNFKTNKKLINYFDVEVVIEVQLKLQLQHQLQLQHHHGHKSIALL